MLRRFYANVSARGRQESRRELTHDCAVCILRNDRILLVTNALSFGTAGIYLPLLSLYRHELGADLALISLILTTSSLVALVGNYFWGWLADRVGRRKPLYLGGLVGGAIGFVWLSQSATISMAWPARLWDGLVTAAVGTIGLTMLGDALATSANKGRSIGLARGPLALPPSICSAPP